LSDASARLRSAQQAAQGTQATVGPGPKFVPATAWANLGADNPEAAIQTFLCAGKNAETNLLGNLLRWQRDRDIRRLMQSLIGGTTQLASSLKGFRVTSQQDEGNNSVRLGIELTTEAGQPESHMIRLVREDNEWFPVMNVWLDQPGSIRATLDVPPKFEQPR